MTKFNILFIMTDQMRYDCLGCNGNQIIKTPGIDQLSKESANFSSFYVQAPVCVPSRQSFFSGRYPRSHKNRVNYTSMNSDVKLMQQYVQDAGYITGFVGKLHYFPPTLAYALSTGFQCGKLHDGGAAKCDAHSQYVEWLRNSCGDAISANYRSTKTNHTNPYAAEIDDQYHETTWCGQETIRMLNEFKDNEKPFFLFSSYWKPHSPFEIPDPWASMYNDAEISVPDKVSPDYIESLPAALKLLVNRNRNYEGYEKEWQLLPWEIRSYYGAVSQIDNQISKTIEELDRLGLRDNTIIIFTSDHGDFLLEHGIKDKNAFYESAVHVPFMMSLPGIIRPGIYHDLFESVDLLSSLFDLCGMETPYSNQGNSFASLITAGEMGVSYSPRAYVHAENIIPEIITDGGLDFSYEKGAGVKGIRHPDAKMVRSKRWKYIYYVDDEELFDLDNDPGEMKNLAKDPLVISDENDQIAPCWYVVKDPNGEWIPWN
jgi:arylsulfatase A-like enzyme